MSAYIEEPCAGGIAFKLRGCCAHKYYVDYCRACLDIQSTEKGIELGRKAEREAIVAWLVENKAVVRWVSAGAEVLMPAAYPIERGDHHNAK